MSSSIDWHIVPVMKEVLPGNLNEHHLPKRVQVRRPTLILCFVGVFGAGTVELLLLVEDVNGKIITHSVLPVLVYLPAQSAVAVIEKRSSFCNAGSVTGQNFLYSTLMFFPLRIILS